MADVVGTALVRLKVLSDGLAKDIRTSIEKGVSDSKLDDVAENMGRSFGDDFSKHASTEIQKGLDKSVDSSFDPLKKKGRLLGDTLGKEIGNGVAPEMDRTSKDIDNKMRRTLGSRNGERHGSSFVRGILKSFKSFDRAFAPITSIIRKVAIGITALTPVLEGAFAIIIKNLQGMLAVVGFVGQAITGLGVASIAAFSAAGLAMLPLIFGFRTLGREMKNATSGPLLEFRITLIGARRIMDDIGSTVNRALVPGLNAAVKNLAGLGPLMKDIGAQTGQAVGEFAQLFTAQLKSAVGQERLRKIMQTGVVIGRQFGDIIIRLGDILSNTLVAALPAAIKFTAVLRNAVIRLQAFTDASVGSGRLARGFSESFDKARLLLRALTNLTIGLFRFFAIGSDASNGLLVTFDRFAARYRAFTESTRGRNYLAEIFRDSIEVMRLTFGILYDISRFILGPAFGTSGNKGLIGFLKYIRASLPRVFNFLRQVGKAIAELFRRLRGPLASLFRAVGDLFSAFKDSGGLALSIELFDRLLRVITRLVQIPAVSQFIASMGALVGVFVVLKSLGVVRIFSGLFSSLSGIAGLLKGALGVGSLVGAGAALGVIAVAAGLAYLAFNNWDKIKEFVKDVWDALEPFRQFIEEDLVPAIQDFGSAFLVGVQPGVDNVLRALKELYNDILKPLAKWSMETLVQAFKDLDEAVENLFGTDIATLFTDLGYAIGTITSANLTGAAIAIDLIAEAGRKIRDINWASVKDNINDIVAGDSGPGAGGGRASALERLSGIIDSVSSAVGRMASYLSGALSGPFAAISSFVLSLSEHFNSFGATVLDDVMPAIERLADITTNTLWPTLGSLAGLVGELLGLFFDLVELAFKPVAFVIETVLGVALYALTGTFRLLGETLDPVFRGLSGVYDLFKKIASFLYDRLENALKGTTTVLEHMRDFIRDLRDGTDELNDKMDIFVGFLKRVRDAADEALKKLGPVLDALGKLTGNGLGKVGEFIGDINPFASGGIINSPTYSLLGEAGREVVIPLTKPSRARELAAQSGLMNILRPSDSASTVVSAPTAPLVGTINTYTLDAKENAVQITRRLSAISRVSAR